MLTERYTIIQHNVRKHFGLKTEEYEVLDAIYCLSRNQACNADVKYYVDLFDISERTYYNIIKKLKEKQLIEKYKDGFRTTAVWDDAMSGRLAPWDDPSKKTAETGGKNTPENSIDESSAGVNNSVTAEFAVCPECAKSLQNLQSVPFKTAEFAVRNCRICRKTLQNLQKTTANFAVLNIVINNVIYNNNNNKELAPAKAGTPFETIDKIFASGSEKHTGQTYYKDAKEAKQIKLLEPRFKNNPEKFIKDAQKFYWLITKSGDPFWMSQPFVPSAFNSLYNRVLSYKPAKDTIEREQRKNKTDEELIVEKYGSCSRSDLDYLFRANVICESDYKMLCKRIPAEIAS